MVFVNQTNLIPAQGFHPFLYTPLKYHHSFLVRLRDLYTQSSRRFPSFTRRVSFFLSCRARFGPLYRDGISSVSSFLDFRPCVPTRQGLRSRDDVQSPRDSFERLLETSRRRQRSPAPPQRSPPWFLLSLDLLQVTQVSLTSLVCVC